MDADNKDELERLRTIVQQRNKSMLLGQLVGAMAHDLNNPLTAVLGNVELLMLNPAAEDPKVKKRIDTIQSGLKRMVDKIRCVQLFTKNGRDDESFDLNEVARQTTVVAGLLPKRSKLVIEQQLAEDELMVQGNSSKLAQALLAIYDNALDAALLAEKPDVKLVTGRNSDNEIFARITNNGPQIDADTAARLFEPFFTTKEEAAGLGLALARRFVEESAGRIEWRSTPAETEFCIFVPAKPTED